MNQYAQIDTELDETEVICDLRSDTVTKPCSGMRNAMADAEVGDDVYGDDPTVNSLEARLSEILGKEAGMFVPSGTQSNLCAVMVHCGRGEEVIVGDKYHVFTDEAAGASVLAGISLFPVPLEDDHSVSAESIQRAIKEDDPHCAISRLVSLENTVHGNAIPLNQMETVSSFAKQRGLSVHLDGARFFNAITALGCSPQDLANTADTVSICLSKGLGAPLGSILTGPKDIISKARRNRKILGGGMRQAGIVAAAGHYALDHNVTRLSEDQERALELAAKINSFGCGKAKHATNMVFWTPELPEHTKLHTHMAHFGVKIGGQTPTIRMVLHKDVTDEAFEICLQAFDAFFAN